MTHVARLSETISLAEWLSPWLVIGAEDDCQVSDLVQDSRAVNPGFAFLFLPGKAAPKPQYIEMARQSGASVILMAGEQPGVRTEGECVFVSLPDLAEVAGDIVHRFFGQPGSAMAVVGVTGTNGKSSVTHFIAQLAEGLGVNAAVIGTLGYGRVSHLKETRHTTPPLVELHRMLAELHSEGCELVAIEVSSHALDQGRVDGVPFDVAVLTNLSRDHLDYHEDMESYAAAKRELFLRPELKSMVLNSDDAHGQQWLQELQGVRKSSYSQKGEASLSASLLGAQDSGLEVQVRWGQQERAVRLPLLGTFNLANFLASLGALTELGYDTRRLLDQVGHLSSVPGRLERVPLDGAPVVIIDYAHTPDALEQVLSALRPHCDAQLWCVFGCGGNRDTGKRATMGRVACDLADRVVVTDDNPRDEDPAVIADAIMSGCRESKRFSKVSPKLVQPREKAILDALENARPDDWVVLAGKGHEDYQEIAGVRYRFSDQDMVRGCWQAIGARKQSGSTVGGQ